MPTRIDDIPWSCEYCYTEHSTYEEAEECEKACKAFLAENPPTCDWCDMPAEHGDLVEDGRCMHFQCRHYDYGWHDTFVGDAENDRYETLQRLRGVEPLPWEYPDVQCGRSSGEEKLYYMQNRGPVGNCILWWAKDYAGYTTHLEDAHVFTVEEAKKVSKREIDVLWDKDFIDSIATRQVDMQKTGKNAGCRCDVLSEVEEG